MSNTQKKNVPELRFPGFEGEWEEKQLGEISEQSMYGIGASATNFDSKNIYIRITDIDEKSRNLNYKNLTTPDEINDKYKLKRNDILFARTGASTGKSYIHKEEKDNYNYYFAGFLIKFEINQLNSPMFIYQFTLTSKFNNWVKVMSVRSGQPGINSEEYAKLPLVLPSKLEQQKIGEFFSKLDRQIELEEQKLELLQQQKKGYMQKIFSQELRFKDENGNDYPESLLYKLSEIGTFNTGIGFPESLQGGKEGIPFFKISDMNNKGNEIIMRNANNYVSNGIIESKKWKIITNVPSMIFAKVGAAIMLNRKRLVLEPFLIDNNTMSYSFSQEWNINFGRTLFQTIYLPKYAQVGALPSYNAKDIGLIKIELPVKEEQKRIGDFFVWFEELIERQILKLDLLKERKRAILQKMFI
ncbi:restriction endonuclease subunit S [Staphylococcus aureus]|nr:restriction endonuclease subunit S [Staphylococcus aureus]UVJ11001.1 restriction endonuclease subunit S [Staphylococcus aureus]